MTEPLRPLNLGGILDRGVQVFRAQPLLFFGLGAIPGLVQLGYRLASVHPRATTNPNAAHILLQVASYGMLFIFWLTSMVFQPVATAAICLAAARVNLGERATVSSALATVTSKVGRLIWLSILQGIYSGWPLIFAIPIALLIGGVADSHQLLSIPALTLVYFLGGIPCVALFTRYALAFPATAMENLPAQAAVQRSASLGEGGRWRICWAFLVPTVPSILIVVGAAALVEQLKTYSPLVAGSPITVAGINGVVGLIDALVFTPYSAIVLTLLYYDQRIRREGFDIEQMMAAAGLNSNPLPPEASLAAEAVPGDGSVPNATAVPDEGHA